MMLHAMMPTSLVKISISDELIELDDYMSGCSAVYIANNPGKKDFIVFETDQGKHNPGPRCDYLMLNVKEETSRYIELKGQPVIHNGEKLNAWDKGFLQLLETYKAYHTYFNDAEDKVYFRLVTSYSGTLPRLLGYGNYVRLRELGYEVKVLQPDDKDSI